jgi:hypothetical protein
MSIKIRFEQGPTVVQTTLKDEAMTALMKIVQEEVSIESEAPPEETSPFEKPRPQTLLDPEKNAKEWLAKHGAAEVLNKLAWSAYPQKILALGAYHESKAGEDFDSWRSADIADRFSEAKDSPPANFPRDIATAIKAGFVTTKTPRTYIVTRTGWNEVAEAIINLPKE